jgi:hypothetical protein
MLVVVLDLLVVLILAVVLVLAMLYVSNGVCMSVCVMCVCVHIILFSIDKNIKIDRFYLYTK